MEYANVKKIEVLDSQEEVNKKLNRSWILLSVDVVTDGDQKKWSFVIGWTHYESEEDFHNNLRDYGF